MNEYLQGITGNSVRPSLEVMMALAIPVVDLGIGKQEDDHGIERQKSCLCMSEYEWFLYPSDARLTVCSGTADQPIAMAAGPNAFLTGSI